jgi:hypothetical protein
LANQSEIEHLAERKRLLLARCEQHRQQMSADLDNLHSVAVWIERGHGAMKRIRTVWPLLATAAGFLIARKGRAAAKTSSSLFGKFGKILSWWRIGKKLTGFWRSYSMAAEERSRAE